MSRPIGIGVAGCGRIALAVHLSALRSIPDARLAALAEPDGHRRGEARRLAAGAKAYTDWRELLTDPEVDAVVVCTPPSEHAVSTVTALRAGRHVYVEKPLGLDLGAARRAVGAWRESGLIGMMGFNFRFAASYRRAREWVRTGRIGEVLAIRSSFCAARRDLPEWKRRRTTGGGALLDLASHHVDLLAFLLEDEVVATQAMMVGRGGEEDVALLQLRLASGILAQVHVGFGTVDEDRFEIFGSGGKLTVDRYRGQVEFLPPVFAYGRRARLTSEGRAALAGLSRIARRPGEPSYETALRAFVRSIRTGVPVHPTLDDGYRCLAVIEAAERSAASRREIVPVLEDALEPPLRGSHGATV